MMKRLRSLGAEARGGADRLSRLNLRSPWGSKLARSSQGFMERDDKRRHARAAIWGVARVTGPAFEHPEILAIRDLSHGGLGLSGGHPLAVGAGLDLDVRLFGEPMTLSGQVAWTAHGGGRSTMGVSLGRSA